MLTGIRQGRHAGKFPLATMTCAVELVLEICQQLLGDLMDFHREASVRSSATCYWRLHTTVILDSIPHVDQGSYRTPGWSCLGLQGNGSEMEQKLLINCQLRTPNS